MEHEKILEALKRRDPDEAQYYLVSHHSQCRSARNRRRERSFVSRARNPQTDPLLDISAFAADKMVGALICAESRVRVYLD